MPSPSSKMCSSSQRRQSYKSETNQPIKRMSAQKRKTYNNAILCYICRNAFGENFLTSPNVRDHDHITEFIICDAHRKCNMERPVSCKIQVCFNNFRKYDATLIVHEFSKRPDCNIK